MLSAFNHVLATDIPNIGVSNGGQYNHDVTITFDSGSALLNGTDISSGTIVNYDGNFSLDYNNESQSYHYNFVIDKTAPVYMGISLSSTSVNLGETLRFSIAFDDLSKSGSSGTLWLYVHEKYIQVPLNYDSGSDKLVGDLVISTSIPNGTWRTDSMRFKDGVGNETQINVRDVTFSVSGSTALDTSAPVVESASVSPIDVVPGNTVLYKIKINDESLVGSSGHLYVYAEGSSEKEVNLTYNATSGYLEGSLKITSDMANGAWRVTDHYLIDGQGNRNMNPGLFYLYFNVTGGREIDTSNPIFNSISLSKLSASPNESVKFTLDVTDENQSGLTGYINIKGIENVEKQISLKYNVSTSMVEGSITVDANMANGPWCVKNIYISDASQNYIQPSVSSKCFDVTGAKEIDTVAPVFKKITLSRNELVAGDILKFSVELEDKNLSLTNGSLIIRGPSSKQYSVNMSYNASTKLLEGSLGMTSEMDNGEYYIFSASFNDGKNGVSPNLTDIKFNLSNASELDNQAPIYKNLSLSKTNVVSGDSIVVSIDIEEDIFNEVTGYIYIVDPESNGRNVYLSYNQSTGTLEAIINISSDMVDGLWKITKINLKDKNLNTSNTDITSKSFTLSGNRPIDTNAPIFKSIHLSSTTVKPGDVISFIIEVSDENLSTCYGHLYVRNEENIEKYIGLSYDSNTKKLIGILPITSDFVNGEWLVTKISISDKAGNNVNQSFNTSSFMISGARDLDKSAPLIESIDISSDTYVYGDTLLITVNAKDVNLKGSNGEVVIRLNDEEKFIKLYYNDQTKKLEGRLVLTNDLVYGEWKLQRISLVDAVGNSMTDDILEKSFILGEIKIGDTEKPVFKSIELSSDTVSPSDLLSFKIEIEDESLISSRAMLFIKGEEKRSRVVNLYYNQATGFLEGSVEISEDMANGDWGIYEMILVDGRLNYTYLYTDGNNYLDNSTFTIINSREVDLNKPNFTGLKITDNNDNLVKTIKFSLLLDQENIEDVSGYIYLKCSNKAELEYINLVYNQETGYLEGTLEVSDDSSGIIREVVEVSVIDGAGNYLSANIEDLSFTSLSDVINDKELNPFSYIYLLLIPVIIFLMKFFKKRIVRNI